MAKISDQSWTVFLSTLEAPARNSHAVLWVALAVLPTFGNVREYSQV
jgi:hypothetical protein